MTKAGFAPNFTSDEQGLDYIVKAIEAAGFRPGKDFAIATTLSSTEKYEAAKEKGPRGRLLFWKSVDNKTRE